MQNNETKISNIKDIKDLRKMNLNGTILFGLFGIFTISCWLWSLYSLNRNLPDPFGMAQVLSFNIYLTYLIILTSFYVFFTSFFYRYTVIGLDRMEYKKVKRWTLIGILFGAMGLFSFIFFAISYSSFNKVIQTS